jgi:hypothetical protein
MLDPRFFNSFRAALSHCRSWGQVSFSPMGMSMSTTASALSGTAVNSSMVFRIPDPWNPFVSSHTWHNPPLHPSMPTHFTAGQDSFRYRML